MLWCTYWSVESVTNRHSMRKLNSVLTIVKLSALYLVYSNYTQEYLQVRLNYHACMCIINLQIRQSKVDSFKPGRKIRSRRLNLAA